MVTNGFRESLDRLMRPNFDFLLKKPRPNADDLERVPMAEASKEHPESAEFNELDGFVRETPVIPPLFFSAIFSLFAAMGGFLGGYDTGIISGAMVYIKDEFKFTDFQTEVVVSGVVAGAIFGSLLSGNLSDVYGRKFVSLASAVVYIIGGLLMCAARGFTSLLIGRIVSGLAVGSGSIAPVYIGEVVPNETRSVFVNLNAFLIAAGQLASYLTAYSLSGNLTTTGPTSKVKENGNWRLMLGLTIVPPLIQLVLSPLMPQSPRYLCHRSKISESARTLLLVESKSKTREEIVKRTKDITQNTKPDSSKSKGMSYIELFSRPEYRRLIVITSVLQALQQFSGINTVMYYSAFILRMVGFPSKSISILFSTLVGLSNSVGSLISMYTISHFKRRSALLVSITGVILGLSALSSMFKTYSLADKTDELGAPTQKKISDIHARSYVSLSCIVFYVIFYAIGLGCIPWNILAEIFPMEARSRGAAFAIATNWVTNLLVSVTFLTFTNLIGASGTFLLYAGIAVFGWVFVYFCVPETKGRSLEEDVGTWNKKEERLELSRGPV